MVYILIVFKMLLVFAGMLAVGWITIGLIKIFWRDEND